MAFHAEFLYFVTGSFEDIGLNIFYSFFTCYVKKFAWIIERSVGFQQAIQNFSDKSSSLKFFNWLDCLVTF